ncbi:YbaN family protein [Rhizobium giardinii]|uniref:DUF454 domain-containing protein n=1 Tax=Rhizobium giardinii TaxID=56731 RepID=A0A7W8XC87_9HYPH|nr:YbaN family protein [Rhizobium giardinii]MBB5539507.1 hypothetical protein [Rhizobium giardinii]
MTRIPILATAWLCVGAGILGIVLPLLPTTPFLILAAWLFSKSSPNLEAWLLSNVVVGRGLRCWRSQRAITLTAKLLAVAAMALSYAWVWTSVSPAAPVKLVLGGVLGACALFIAIRPTPRRD